MFLKIYCLFSSCELYSPRHLFPTICSALVAHVTKPEIRIAASETLRFLQREVQNSTDCTDSSSSFKGDDCDVTNWTDDPEKRRELKKVLSKG